MRQIFIIISFLLLLLNSCTNQNQKSSYPEEVEEKLRDMSLEEKIGQMTMICLSEVTEGRDKKLVPDEERIKELIENYHIGAFLSATGSASEWKSFTKEVQELNMEVSSSQVPLLFGIDHIHGANYVDEGTFFPHNLLLACSFDTALVAKTARITARETAGLGVLWNFSPVLDLGKNPLWPRLYETFGEDPYLGKQLGAAYISAYENYQTESGHYSSGCLKHFVGYSDPRSGYDRSPAEIPDQILYEMFLPPFREAIKAGGHSVMLNSGEVNGVPVHISEKYIRGLLRKELGFEGVVLTDIKDILKVVEMHHAVPTVEEAVVLAVRAGIDMSMSCNDTEFFTILLEKVREGVISEERIDSSVRRILNMKYELGLFDNPFPGDEFSFTNEKQLSNHRSVAFEAAVQSQVLLKNDGILPLDVNSNLLVTGYSMNSKRNLNGAWTLEWLGAEESRQPVEMNTLYEALRKKWEGKVNFVDPESEIFEDNFLVYARNADAIILTIGEDTYSEFKGNIEDLAMPERCKNICNLAFATGKPVILVLIEGRPRLLTGISEYATAILFSGYPGIRGGEAITAILSGKENPSGKLAFSYPSNDVNYAPYNSKITREYSPEFPFGYGLSYTDFSYSDLQLNDTVFTQNDSIEISLRIENTGDREGKEVVLLYASDKFGKITRPRKELIRFTKIMLDEGESQDVKFVIFPEQDFSYPDENGKQILEPGVFEIICGDLKKEIKVN
jgi:beta-glucosidase